MRTCVFCAHTSELLTCLVSPNLPSVWCAVFGILLLYSFIIARSRESGNPCGFVNFRFDLDDGVEVAYW